MSDRKEIPAPQPASAGESLDKVRDILFGAQAREVEQRFAQLEAQLLQKTAEAREEAHRRLDLLEGQLKQEVKQLTDNLKAEQAQRADTFKNLAAELKTVTHALEQKINQLDNRTNKGQNELQQQFATQTKTMATEFERRVNALNSALQQEAAELTDTKLNRLDIAGMFTEMAKRIAGEKTK